MPPPPNNGTFTNQKTRARVGMPMLDHGHHGLHGLAAT
jgi:hypothetical protein